MINLISAVVLFFCAGSLMLRGRSPAVRRMAKIPFCMGIMEVPMIWIAGSLGDRVVWLTAVLLAVKAVTVLCTVLLLGGRRQAAVKAAGGRRQAAGHLRIERCGVRRETEVRRIAS